LIHNLPRRLERLESRLAPRKPWFFSARILLVHPEKGLTGVVLLETGKPTTRVPATPEDEESVRDSLKRHRERSGKPTDISH
jgi:hypothetical protein